MLNATEDMTRAELDAMFDEILNSQPHTDLAAVTVDDVRARQSAIVQEAGGRPSILTAAAGLAALYSQDDDAVIGAATRFMEMSVARAFKACGESAENLATANTRLTTLTEDIVSGQIGGQR